MALAINLGSTDMLLPEMECPGEGGGRDSNVPPAAPLRMEARPSTAGALGSMLAEAASRAIPTLMPDERAIVAISRIERALTRIEAAAGRQPAGNGSGEELEQLKRQHQALRERVQGAVSQIDQLLASREEAMHGDH
ncbi:MAG TPA: hypothetical protein VGD10_09910 [Allosphingosinicella sp.]|uniref:hypothetical protein n=1 Tax=Allosphingosinicella sp. TaxID=2823234 RepID=UPI002ED84447